MIFRQCCAIVQSKRYLIGVENLYNKGDCVCVCLFSIGGHTVGPTVLKFGMEDHIYPGEVIGYILFRYPYPRVGGGQRVVLEVRAAQTVHFCENFIKQKLKGNPENGGWVGLRICRGC